MKSCPTSRRMLFAAGMACAILPGLALAQAVTYFDKPPSAEELARALRVSAQPSAPTAPDPAAASAPLTRGLSRNAGQRGIEWGMAPSQSGQASPPAQQPTPASSVAAGHASQRPVGNGPAVAMPVNFDLGSSQIRQNSMGYIDAIAQALQHDPALRLTVEGHTDATGNPNQNLMLSWDRALTVYKVLVGRYGIDPQRLQPIGKGPFEPIPGTGATESVQRRVQFRVISTE